MDIEKWIERKGFAVNDKYASWAVDADDIRALMSGHVLVPRLHLVRLVAMAFDATEDEMRQALEGAKKARAATHQGDADGQE